MLPKFVDAITARGRTYYYFRRAGQRIRLPDITDPSFQAAYEKLVAPADKARPTIVPGSVGAVAAAFQASPEWAQLATKTKADYARYLSEIVDVWGDLPMRQVKRHHIFALRDQFGDTPRTANYVVQVASRLLSFALDRGEIEVHPARHLKDLKTGEGYRPWEDAEIAMFRQRWPANTLERVCFELVLNTGLRGGDAHLLGRPHYSNGVIRVRTRKAGNRVEIPASRALTLVLDGWIDAHPENVSFLVTTKGTTLKVDAFRHLMRDAYDAAGLPADCHTHGLRSTTATLLIELGVDHQTVTDILGHSTLQMALHYTRKRRRVRAAITKLDGWDQEGT